MRIPYGRPMRLSDPFKDFEHDGDMLVRILAVKDSEMGWHELSAIFQSFVPAGTYEECAFFIPQALRFIQGSNKESSSLIQQFALWCDCNCGSLEKDGLMKPVMESFHGHFKRIISSFSLSRSADGFLYPLGANELQSYVETMHECNKSPNMMLACEAWLKESFLPLKSSFQAFWLLVIVNYYISFKFYKSTFVDELIENKELMSGARSIVESFSLSSKDEELLEYWDHELKRLPVI